MKYIAAYCLVALSGKTVSAAEVKKVLESVGITVEESKLNQLCDSLKDKTLHEVTIINHNRSLLLVSPK